MFQDSCGTSLGFRPFLPSIIRQYNYVQILSEHRESGKPTGQTPPHIQLLVTGNKHSQTTTPRSLITTERPGREVSTFTVPTLPSLVRTAAVKTDKPRAPLLQSVPLPQVLTRQVKPVPRNPDEEPARADKQSPLRQRNSGYKNKRLRKDKQQKPLRLLTFADIPPVTESVRTLLMSKASVQQRSHPQRADGDTRTRSSDCCVKMWMFPTWQIHEQKKKKWSALISVRQLTY